LLGLDPLVDVSERFADEQITISCFLKKTNEVLQRRGLEIGHKIILFQSLRPTKDYFMKLLGSFKYHIFDKGTSYISALIKN
jgi:hypothetical protein